MERKVLMAFGSRKRAVARVRVKLGAHGWIYVNGKRPEEYFKREDLVLHATEPLRLLGLLGQVDVVAKVEGGGLSGQAGAFRHAVARALASENEDWERKLRDAGMLRRDPREKERMKYGRTKRRKAWQYSKR